MQNDYVKKAVPDAVTILGVRLLPFCIGHFNLLARIGSAYVTGGKITHSELLAGITVCSKSFEDGLAFFTKPGWENEIVQWGQRVTGNTFIHRKILRRKLRLIDWDEKFLLFSRYIEDGMELPKISANPDNCRESSAPWQETLMLQMLKLNPNYTESQLLNYPLALMREKVATLQESQDVIRYKDSEELSLEEEAWKYAEELEREAKGV